MSRFDFTGGELVMEPGYGPAPEEDEKQMGLALAESAVAYRVTNSTKSAVTAKRLKHARR